MTKAETGLPGRPKTPGAKQNGLPGLIATLCIRIETPSASSAGITRSQSPTDTPPDRSSTSRFSPSRRRARISSRSSPTTPRSSQDSPIDRTCAASENVFEFRICPGPGFRSGATSSSPVASTAHRGRA